MSSPPDPFADATTVGQVIRRRQQLMEQLLRGSLTLDASSDALLLLSEQYHEAMQRVKPSPRSCLASSSRHG